MFLPNIFQLCGTSIMPSEVMISIRLKVVFLVNKLRGMATCWKKGHRDAFRSDWILMNANVFIGFGIMNEY